MRWTGPRDNAAGWSPADVRGRHLAPGETVSLMWVAANRDPAAFDEPASVRLDRDLARSRVRGGTIHVCLGAPLARLQIRAALTQLLQLTTRFEVAGEVRRSVSPGNALAECTIGLR